MSIYLDYNASSPVLPEVLDCMIKCYQENFGNPDSRTHGYGAATRTLVEQSRAIVAELLGAEKEEVFFTSGATESNNIAILGLESYGRETGKMHMVTTSIEHKAVLEPMKVLANRGFEVEYVNPSSSGRINAQELLSKVRKDTLLVSVMHVNNETGIIQPVDEIGKVLNERKTLFHIDASQSMGKLIDEVKSIECDLLSTTAHKIGGPQGIGALLLRQKKYKYPPVLPISFGGGQEHGIRPGTLPVALIAGFGKACKIAQNSNYINDYHSNQKTILSKLLTSGVDYKIHGEEKYQLPNTMNISFCGVNSEALMIATKEIIAVSNGSACTAKDYEHSHVLKAMNLSEEDLDSALRLSWGIAPIPEENLTVFFDTILQFQR